MPLITNSNALQTAFVPAAGDFIAQASGGAVNLFRRNVTGAAWVLVRTLYNEAVVIANPVAGAEYQWDGALPSAPAGSVTVRADQ